jgi:branched-chain amino acid transport system permease protein
LYVPAKRNVAQSALSAIVIAGAGLALIPLAGLPLFYESFLYLVFHWIVLATS